MRPRSVLVLSSLNKVFAVKVPESLILTTALKNVRTLICFCSASDDKSLPAARGEGMQLCFLGREKTAQLSHRL